MNQLQAAEMLEVEEIKAQSQRVTVNTAQDANWVFRKLVAINAKRQEVKALQEQEMYRIKLWAEKELTKMDEDAEHLNSALSDFARRQREVDPEFKKISTPYGSVAFQKQQDKWEYNDAVLLDSLKQAGLTELIRIKEEPNKVDLKKRAAVKDGVVVDPDTGAILDGVTVTEQPDKLVVKISE